MRLRCVCLAALGLALLAGAGCGGMGGGKDQPVPVEGVVNLEGQPLSGATVQFVPDGGSGPPANGLTGTDGTFRLTTWSSGDGALPGEYRVVVTYSVPETGGVSANPSDPKSMTDAMRNYKDKMKAPGASSKSKKVHDNYTKAATTPLKQRVPPSGKVTLDLRNTGA